MHTLVAGHPAAIAEAGPHALQAVWAAAAAVAVLGVLACRWLPDAPMEQQAQQPAVSAVAAGGRVAA
ncbi:hypothetical protein D3C87_2160340 [compost metagenome]